MIKHFMGLKPGKNFRETFIKAIFKDKFSI